jgi:acyl carrier protein
MTDMECRSLLAEVLADVAPDADLDSVSSDANIRTELDLDSLDFLSLVQGVSARTGVEIRERDYGRLVSISDWRGYLSARLPGAVESAGRPPGTP